MMTRMVRTASRTLTRARRPLGSMGFRIEDLGGWNVTPMSIDKNKHYQRQFTLRTCEKSAPGRAARVEADQRLGSVTTSGGRSQ